MTHFCTNPTSSFMETSITAPAAVPAPVTAVAPIPAAPVEGQSLQPPPTKTTSKVQNGNKEKRPVKKRKAPRHKGANKATKRPKSKHKALKPAPSVKGLVPVDPSNKTGVLTNVSKGAKEAGKKAVKKNKKKAATKEKKRKPAKPRKKVSKSNLSTSSKKTANKLFTEESGKRFNSPREGEDSGHLSQSVGGEMALVNQEVPHNSYRQLEEEAQAEVTEQNVPVGDNVFNSRLITWEHFALVYEEYSMCTEVSNR